MITILADHNIEGQALLLWGTLSATGWLDFLSIRLVYFTEVGLRNDSSDRIVWRFAQAHEQVVVGEHVARALEIPNLCCKLGDLSMSMSRSMSRSRSRSRSG